MRRWILILMIFLLPLRAWAGGVMLGALCDEHPAPVSIAQAAPCHPDAVSAHTDPAADPATGSHAGHQLCDLCHGPALTAPPAALSVPAPLMAAAPAPRVWFANVWLGLDHRPPIA
ncbi:MAG: hypothetical protein JNK17_07410 [Hydrogenophaga sp.]|nr:hypothetical protein [Hydrogenophaga sp.]